MPVPPRIIYNYTTTEFRYETYCGLYCGACDILMAYQRGLEQQTPPEWSELGEPLRRHIPQAEIVCHGCKTDTVFAGCAKCPIRKCGRNHPEIETCLDCKRYPCWRHKFFKIVVALLNFEKKLPHQKIKPRNLQTIREKGLRAWLEEQQRVWACPDCQTSFSWYQRKCKQCGRELDSIKDYNNLK